MKNVHTVNIDSRHAAMPDVSDAAKSPSATQGDAAGRHVVDACTPWWKEPMMWLVVGLPASVVVAGVWTFVIASRVAL